MNYENEYLSDEQLNNLICEVEECAMVTAPPDMLECILAKVEDMASEPATSLNATELEGEQREINRPPKIIEFRKYCFKVVSAAAVAILILGVVPTLLSYRPNTIPSKEEVRAEKQHRLYNADNNRRLFSRLQKENYFSNNHEIGLFDNLED